MGLLAPLYALAALAIVGPVLFHLIQRKPRGQLQFSSLIFLSPSPPSLTRRSRLDNLWLLLLRALAIGLIAIAFARPYLRQENFLTTTLNGRNIVALLDTSGSMQRPDVWQAAVASLGELIDSLSPEDRLALYTIDEKIRPIVPFDSADGATAAMLVQSVRAAIPSLKPTWQRTKLADGLKTIADLMSTATISGKLDPSVTNELVLISDLHVDSALESLQGFPWPEAIQLDVRRILPEQPGNARPSLMFIDEEEQERNLKVRIENNRDSPQQAFQLAWARPDSVLSDTTTTVQVPVGQVRVLPLAARPSGATRLLLMGDSWDGDNALFIAEADPTRERIAFIGPGQSRDEDSLDYFLKKAPLSTPQRQREVFNTDAQQLDLTDSALKAVVIEPTNETEAFAKRLREFAAAGGTLIVCLARPVSDQDPQVTFLEKLTDQVGLTLSEMQIDDFALVADIDYSHPVFAPFADPRFNDFSKLRFWSHRSLNFPELAPKIRVVANYDDQQPMLIEASVGKGHIWVLTSGWQPASSSLALSSKFVPLLMGMLDPTGRAFVDRQNYEVGELVEVDGFGDGELSPSDIRVLREDGSEVDSSLMVLGNGGVAFLEPGLYQLDIGQARTAVAVQVPASESQLLPLDIDVFEQYGIALGNVASDSERRAAMRQLQVEELEGKQKLWQWLIVVGISVIGLETVVAGLKARRLRRP